MFFEQKSAAFAGGKRSSAALLAKSLLLAIVAVGSVHANSNLLQNGDFYNANALKGWTAEGSGSISFIRDFDAENAPGSGSMQLTYADRSHPENAASSCFAVKPGTPYTFGGKSTFVNEFGTISSAKMQCKSFSATDCSAGAADLGVAEYSYGTEPNPNNDFATLAPIDGTLGATARSAQCTVTAYTSFMTTDVEDVTNPVEVDDMFFESDATVPSPASLGGYLSGSWYDPTQSGQGFMLEFTAQANQLIAAWFTFTPDGSGKPIWIYAQGEYDPLQSAVTIPAAISSGTSFPPAFHGSDITKTPWGTLTFTFTDCDHASVAWNSTLPGFGSGAQQLRRLTSISGSSCPSTGVFF